MFLKLLSSALLISGLVGVFIATAGIFGYSTVMVITRKKALNILLGSFFVLLISGQINNNYVLTSETQTVLQNSIDSTTSTNLTTQTTIQKNTVSKNTSQLQNSNTYKINTQDVLSKLSMLLINDDFSGIPSYDRDLYFGTWVDEDNDCQDTRAEVLILESLSIISYKDSKQCKVVSGEWYDPYTNNYYYLASDLDVDHFVPLYEAYYAGAYSWTDVKREEYANDIFLFEDHLIAVDSGANRSKGKKPPQEWMPTNKDYHCKYLANWIEIKYLWELTITTSEKDFIESELQNC